jgi:hypothetical protein
MCFSYYKSRKDPHPAVRAARGKYSVPTREFVAYRGGTGSRGASGRGVELAGPSPTPASRFSLSLSLSLSAFPSSSDGSVRWWSQSRGPERETASDRDGPAGRYSSPVPPLRARPVLFFLSASNGWPWLRHPKDDRFSPRRRCVAGVRDVRPRVHSPAAGPRVLNLRVKRAPNVLGCLLAGD